MPKKLEKNQTNQQSPYQVFNQWLFDEDIMNETPPNWVISAINPVMILQSLSKCGALTVYLNDMYNNFSLYQTDRVEFFKYLKELIIQKKIKKYQSCFFKHHKEDKDITLIHNHVPQLKRHEVAQFLNSAEKDKDFYETFLITIGLKQEKKSKLTAPEKKEVKKRIEELRKTEKEEKEKNQITLNDWENSFS